MSASARRLRSHPKRKVTITSRAAGVGRAKSWNLGTGYRPIGEGLEESPIGLPLENPVLVATGAYHGVALRSDRTVEVYGQNFANQNPWTTGPEGFWSAVWQPYRTNLHGQEVLEKPPHNLSRAEIEAEEKSFKIRTSGQIVYRKGAIVIWNGGTWEAQVENTGVEPNPNSEVVWKAVEPAVVQFLLHPILNLEEEVEGEEVIELEEQWLPYAYNLGLPVKAPQLTKVVSIALAGAHGMALVDEGAGKQGVRMWGRATRYGVAGTGFDGSWGEKPRPLGNPPHRHQKFEGTLAPGSKLITNLGNVGESHNKGNATASYGIATTEDAKITLPSFEFSTNEAGAGSLTIGCSISHVSVTQPKVGTVTLEAGGGETTIAKITGGPVKAKVPVKILIEGILPAEEEIKRAETEESVTEEGALSGSLAVALAKENPLIALPVTKTKLELFKGNKITIKDTEGHSQVWTVSGNLKEGSESIPVEPQVPNSSYPTNSQVFVTSFLENEVGTLADELTKENPIELIYTEGTPAFVKGQRIILKDGAGHSQVWVVTQNVSATAPTFAASGGTAIGSSSLHLTGSKGKGFNNGVLITISKLTVGVTGLVQGNHYYVVGEATNTFELASELNGPAIKVTGHELSTDTEFSLLQSAPVEPTIPNFPYPAKTTKFVKAKGFEPAQRKVLFIEMKKPALGHYSGRLELQKPPREIKFWPGAPYTYDAGWPFKLRVPEGVSIAAIATGADAGTASSLALAQTGTTEFPKGSERHVPVGKVLAWGSNVGGQLGDLSETVNKEKYNSIPQYVKVAGGADMTGIVAIACGEQHCMALTENHEIYVWGGLGKGAGGKIKSYEEESGHTSTPEKIPGLPITVGKRPVGMAGSLNTSFILLEDGTLRTLGGNEHGEIGNGTIGGKLQPKWKPKTSYTVGKKVSDLGSNWKCIVEVEVTNETRPGEDPTHWAFEATIEYTTPTEVAGLSGVRYVAGGRYHVAAVTTSGEAYTWGDNTNGELANGKSIKAKTDTAHGNVQKVNLGGRKAWSVACSEFNTTFVIEGATAPEAKVYPKLHLEGSFNGEQAAYLDLEWASPLGKNGWEVTYKRQPTWWEEAVLEITIAQLEEELAEAEFETEEEEKNAEELLTKLQKVQKAEKGGTTVHISSSEVTESAGKLHYRLIASGPITQAAGYRVTLENSSSSWNHVQIFTNGLWSPYGIH